MAEATRVPSFLASRRTWERIGIVLSTTHPPDDGRARDNCGNPIQEACRTSAMTWVVALSGFTKRGAGEPSHHHRLDELPSVLTAAHETTMTMDWSQLLAFIMTGALSWGRGSMWTRFAKRRRGLRYIPVALGLPGGRLRVRGNRTAPWVTSR